MYAELDTTHVATTVAAIWGNAEPDDYVEPEYHISQIPPTMRTAAYLATANLLEDAYHNSIAGGAHVILARHCTEVCHGERWLYRTQYASGATLWTHPTEPAIIVHPSE